MLHYIKNCKHTRADYKEFASLAVLPDSSSENQIETRLASATFKLNHSTQAAYSFSNKLLLLPCTSIDVAPQT